MNRAVQVFEGDGTKPPMPPDTVSAHVQTNEGVAHLFIRPEDYQRLKNIADVAKPGAHRIDIPAYIGGDSGVLTNAWLDKTVYEGDGEPQAHIVAVAYLPSTRMEA